MESFEVFKLNIFWNAICNEELLTLCMYIVGILQDGKHYFWHCMRRLVLFWRVLDWL
jgi:hypothetical protein